MKQDINRYEIIEKITPLIENTAMRFNLIPIEIEFVLNVTDVNEEQYWKARSEIVTFELCSTTSWIPEDENAWLLISISLLSIVIVVNLVQL